MTYRIIPMALVLVLVGCPPNVERHHQRQREQRRIQDLKDQLELRELVRERERWEALVRKAEAEDAMGPVEAPSSKTTPETSDDR